MVKSGDGSKLTVQFGNRLEFRSFLSQAMTEGRLVPVLSKSSAGLVKFVVPTSPLPVVVSEVYPLTLGDNFAVNKGEKCKEEGDDKDQEEVDEKEKISKVKEEEDKKKKRKPSLISESQAQLRRFLRLGS